MTADEVILLQVESVSTPIHFFPRSPETLTPQQRERDVQNSNPPNLRDLPRVEFGHRVHLTPA